MASFQGNSVEDLESGARIDVNEKKKIRSILPCGRKPILASNGTKWSEGRPGWHTECCVMIDSIFRAQNGYIDIHGGGFDLKFPHHENEMAQAKAHNGNKLARYWVHNGFINVNNEKMSKIPWQRHPDEGRGGPEYGGMAFRLMLLAAHYRAPASFSEDTIKEAQVKFSQLQEAKKAAIILAT
jgi:cysteinyl-tRNA synthetase